MYFVIQKKHDTTSAWANTIHNKDTYDDAMHQFHAFMSTYAYGQAVTCDYATCSVEDEAGTVIFGPEVYDNRQ